MVLNYAPTITNCILYHRSCLNFSPKFVFDRAKYIYFRGYGGRTDKKEFTFLLNYSTELYVNNTHFKKKRKI